MGDTFTSRDMDKLLASGDFAKLPAHEAFAAVRSAVDNPVTGNGETASPEAFDREGASRYLLSEYVRGTVQQDFRLADMIAQGKTEEKSRAVAQAIQLTTGVSAQEYDYARAARAAGDSSDLLRIYSKFIARC